MTRRLKQVRTRRPRCPKSGKYRLLRGLQNNPGECLSTQRCGAFDGEPEAAATLTVLDSVVGASVRGCQRQLRHLMDDVWIDRPVSDNAVGATARP